MMSCYSLALRLFWVMYRPSRHWCAYSHVCHLDKWTLTSPQKITAWEAQTSLINEDRYYYVCSKDSPFSSFNEILKNVVVCSSLLLLVVVVTVLLIIVVVVVVYSGCVVVISFIVSCVRLLQRCWWCWPPAAPGAAPDGKEWTAWLVARQEFV